MSKKVVQSWDGLARAYTKTNTPAQVGGGALAGKVGGEKAMAFKRILPPYRKTASMDKIAAYEMLLEDHPLWIKEAGLLHTQKALAATTPLKLPATIKKVEAPSKILNARAARTGVPRVRGRV